MARRSFYPHGADLSIYPTVAVMRDAYLSGYYRSYPRQADPRIGPLPEEAAGADERTRAVLAEMRPTCHAVIVMPRKVLLIRFARRAMRRDVERLDYERGLVRQTPELAAVAHWQIEARIVHCDIADGVEDAAREHGITLKLYRPRWLYTHRPRNQPKPSHGFIVRRFDPERLAAYAHTHNPLGHEKPTNEQLRERLRAGAATMTAEQRSARNSKAMVTRWAKISAEERSRINRQRGARRWNAMTAEQRSDLARRLNAARWQNRSSSTESISH